MPSYKTSPDCRICIILEADYLQRIPEENHTQQAAQFENHSGDVSECPKFQALSAKSQLPTSLYYITIDTVCMTVVNTGEAVSEVKNSDKDNMVLQKFRLTHRL